MAGTVQQSAFQGGLAGSWKNTAGPPWRIPAAVNGRLPAVCLVPEDKLGIIVLTNTDANTLRSLWQRDRRRPPLPPTAITAASTRNAPNEQEGEYKKIRTASTCTRSQFFPSATPANTNTMYIF